MPKNFKAKIDTKAFDKAVKKVPKLLAKSIEFGLQQIGDEFIAEMQDVFTTKPGGPFKSNQTKSKLINRTGTLRRSIRGPIITGANDANGMTLRVTIGDSLTAHYARIQEEGGTIKPKRARALTIPLPANKTGAGRVRFTRARDVPGGFILNTTNGKAFIVSEDEKGEFTFWFMLVGQVKVPARLGFRRRWKSKRNAKRRKEILNLRIYKTLEKAGLL